MKIMKNVGYIFPEHHLQIPVFYQTKAKDIQFAAI